MREKRRRERSRERPDDGRETVEAKWRRAVDAERAGCSVGAARWLATAMRQVGWECIAMYCRVPIPIDQAGLTVSDALLCSEARLVQRVSRVPIGVERA